MQFARVDTNTGIWREDVILDVHPLLDTWPQDADGNPIPPYDPDLPRYVPDPAYVATPSPGGLITPRWLDGAWVEGCTEELGWPRWTDGGLVYGVPPGTGQPPPKTTDERLEELAANVNDALLAIMYLSIE